MRARILEEPELEFGNGGRHVDPRTGISDYGPVDGAAPGAPRTIRVGIVGPADGVTGVRQWLERCREPIDAKEGNRHPSLFRDFPGCSSNSAFRAELVVDDSWTRPIAARSLKQAVGKPIGLATAECVDLYHQEIADLSERGVIDVVIVARPDDLEDDIPARSRSNADELEESTTLDAKHVDFHDLLKARSTAHRPPIQIVRSTTWDPQRDTAKKRSRRRPSLQDEATRAWNIHTALYYKAGGVPWRLQRRAAQLDSLFVGVSFFHTNDRTRVHTSVAQVFDERGEGVVVRGGPAARHKDDRQPHLDRDGAAQLLGDVLDAYRREHHNFPARVVVHKTSAFDDTETSGFEDAADQRFINHLELIWISDGGEGVRLFRDGDHPVLRGTLATIARDRHLLYTRGSVEYYRVYPGMYVPSPIGLRPALAESDIETLATEVLALSKMNWNQSQLDGRLPITLKASRRVASILKHMPTGAGATARYAHFM